MIDIVNTVCAYTSASIHKTKCEIKIDHEQDFFTISKENGLIPMVYESIDHTKVSAFFETHIKKHFYAFVAHDTNALKYIDLVDDILNQYKIKHIFLKGSILKPLYPQTYYRGMGDIDILIQEDDLSKVHEVFKKHDIILKHKSEQHDSFEINGQMTIEIHPKLYKEFNKKYEVLFSDPWAQVIHIKEDRYQFNPTYEIVYLLYHLAKHLDTSGIGLRSMLDIGIYLNANKEKINKEELLSYLKAADMITFFTQIVYLNIKYFKFKTLDDFLFDQLLDDQKYDDIMVFFATSGIHGTGLSHNPFASRVAAHELKNKSKISLLLSILFPNYKSMIGMYPSLRKIPFALPIYWMVRWIKLIVFKTKNTVKKLFQFKSTKNVDKLKDIYKDLGL